MSKLHEFFEPAVTAEEMELAVDDRPIVNFTAEDLRSITGAVIGTVKDKDVVTLTRGITQGSGLSLGEAVRSLKEKMGIKD